MPQAALFQGSAVYKGNLYCFGGNDTFRGTVLDNVQIYQPSGSAARPNDNAEEGCSHFHDFLPSEGKPRHQLSPTVFTVFGFSGQNDYHKRLSGRVPSDHSIRTRAI